MNDLVARFAPSPTGFLHIGGIRTALINYIIIQQSKKNNPKSKFLLRIEDTDKARSKKEYNESIINGLKWIGLNWDDDIFIQSNQASRHKEIAYELLNKGNAYKCICTPEKLDLIRLENKKNHINIKRLCNKCENDIDIQNVKKNYCIRIKIPENGEITLIDNIQGKVTIKNKEIDNFILLRKDGSPTYMLSVVVDDYDMKVNTIIRGNDHISNTFKQIHIYNHLKWKIPEYSHLPLIHGADGSKLSKRHGAIDINEFNEKGYLPDSIINNLILLGWSPKKNNEIIDLKEIIKIFKINQMSKSSSIFDYNKLNFFNNCYLKKEENLKFFYKYIEDDEDIKKYFEEDNLKIKRIFEIYKNKINVYSDLKNIVNIYFDHKYGDLLNDTESIQFSNILKEFIKKIENIYDWNCLHLDKIISDFVEEKKIKFSLFGQPLRCILINSKNGPSISEILYILGKKNVFIRLNKYIEKIN